MPDAPTLPRRRSIRLPGFDYSDEGWYFITIKTFNHVHMFGEIESGNMKLSLESREVVYEGTSLAA